jgi:hypothetical protein
LHAVVIAVVAGVEGCLEFMVDAGDVLGNIVMGVMLVVVLGE